MCQLTEDGATGREGVGGRTRRARASRRRAGWFERPSGDPPCAEGAQALGRAGVAHWLEAIDAPDEVVARVSASASQRAAEVRPAGGGYQLALSGAEEELSEVSRALASLGYSSRREGVRLFVDLPSP